jgi:transposase
VRHERELARFPLHLVKHRSSLKNRIHSTPITFGKPCPVSDLFGVAGRKLLERLQVPEPWRDNLKASIILIDELDRQIDAIASELRHVGADHPYVPLLMSAPGVGWLVGFSIAYEIGDINRFPSPTVAGRSQSMPPNTCAGRCSRPRFTRAITRSTRSATSAPRNASAASAAPRSRRSTSPESSPRRSGTC